MPTRLRLIEGEQEWVAEVTADDVRLSAVTEGGDRATPTPAHSYVVRPGGDDEVVAEDANGAQRATAVLASDIAWVSVGGQVFEVRVAPAGRAARSSTRDHDALAPPMSATVVRIAVTPGDRVHQGDLLVALEAMKMELPIRAPRDGIVTAVHCREGELVQPGTALVDMDHG
ncbi:MAG TPA: biotin/lipoyl-containing protein [Vicinamibacterales bacterium]|nr:biotin/lipoyl-containing protein [Vicinamibacterales bacterium]